MYSNQHGHSLKNSAYLLCGDLEGKTRISCHLNKSSSLGLFPDRHCQAGHAVGALATGRRHNLLTVTLTWKWHWICNIHCLPGSSLFEADPLRSYVDISAHRWVCSYGRQTVSRNNIILSQMEPSSHLKTGYRKWVRSLPLSKKLAQLVTNDFRRSRPSEKYIYILMWSILSRSRIFASRNVQSLPNIM